MKLNEFTKKYWLKVPKDEWFNAKAFYGAVLANKEKELMILYREDLYNSALDMHPEWKPRPEDFK